MWLLWSVLSRCRPSQQSRKMTWAVSPVSPLVHWGGMFTLDTEEPSPHPQYTTEVDCGPVAAALPAMIFRSGGQVASGPGLLSPV